MANLTREEKIKIFEENKRVVEAIGSRKYTEAKKYSNYDDIIQIGYIQLWNLIDKKGVTCVGEKERKYTYNMVWSAMGGYLRRKINLDDRCKKNKGIEFASIDFSISKHDNPIIEVISNHKNFEKESICKLQAKFFIEFADNVDLNIFKGDKKYKKIIKLNVAGYSQSEIGKIMEISQVEVSRRIREIFSIIKDTYKDEDIAS